MSKIFARQDVNLIEIGHDIAAAVAFNRDGFLCDYHPFLQALEQRVKWEEEKFHPAIQLPEHLQRAAG